MTETEKVMQPRAVATKETLLNVAAEVFAGTGFHAASLRDITKAAGLTQGALYFHFDSKLHLATEIIERQHAASIATVEAVLASDDSGLEGIVRLSSMLAKQIASDPIVRAGLRLSTESVDELAKVSSRPYSEWISACRILLERASARGELAAGIDQAAAAELVVSAFSGTQYLAVALRGSESLEQRLARMWPVLLRGFAVDAGHPVITDPARFMRELPTR